MGKSVPKIVLPLRTTEAFFEAIKRIEDAVYGSAPISFNHYLLGNNELTFPGRAQPGPQLSYIKVSRQNF